jgi:hypothetical protein
MATRYWIVSLPVQTPGATATSLWSRLQDGISRHSFDTPLYRVILSLSLPLPPSPESNHPEYSYTKLA